MQNFLRHLIIIFLRKTKNAETAKSAGLRPAERPESESLYHYFRMTCGAGCTGPSISTWKQCMADLTREMSSRAWPRSAAPHRSLPHDREKPLAGKKVSLRSTRHCAPSLRSLAAGWPLAGHYAASPVVFGSGRPILSARCRRRRGHAARPRPAPCR